MIHPGTGDRIWISAKAADRLCHRYALRVRSLQVFAIESSSQNFAAKVGALVANAFLIRKSGDFDSKGQCGATIMKLLNTRNCNQHPKRPIEFPRISHRIQMRPEQAELWTLDFPPTDSVQ